MRLAIVADSGMNAVFAKLIILQFLGIVRNTTWVEILSREQQVKLSFLNYCSILRLSCHIIFFIYPGTAQSKKINVGFQGSRLTFQLASPVASDRFHSTTKTDFSLARYSDNLK